MFRIACRSIAYSQRKGFVPYTDTVRPINSASKRERQGFIREGEKTRAKAACFTDPWLKFLKISPVPFSRLHCYNHLIFFTQSIRFASPRVESGWPQQTLQGVNYVSIHWSCFPVYCAGSAGFVAGWLAGHGFREPVAGTCQHDYPNAAVRAACCLSTGHDG